MKSWVLISSIIIVAIIIGAFFLFNESGEESSPLNTNNENLNETSPVEEEENNLPPPEPTPAPQTYNIEIKDFEFSPSELRIKVGDTVVWTNKDFSSHTVTSDSGNELDSEFLSKEEEYSHTFFEKGTFDYHCIPHPYMKGVIIVE